MDKIIKDVEPPPDQRVDPLLYRIVVIALATVSVLTLVAGFVLAWVGKELSDAAWAIGGSSVTALAWMLKPKGE